MLGTAALADASAYGKIYPSLTGDNTCLSLIIWSAVAHKSRQCYYRVIAGFYLKSEKERGRARDGA